MRPASFIAVLLNAIVAVSCGAATIADAADVGASLAAAEPQSPAAGVDATGGTTRQMASSPADPQVAAARSIVTRCSEADSDAIGLTELQEACPGLEHALVVLGYAPFMAEQQADTLTVHGLVDLLELTRRYREPPRAEAAPDVAKLAPILESLQLQQRAQAPQGWLARFEQWLRDLFEQRASQQPGDSWFERWWSEHTWPERWVNIMTYGLIGLVLLLAITVIVNEIRAGWIKDGPRRRAKTADGAAAAAMPRYTLADLDSVAPASRPALMLQVLVNTLVEAGRLRADRSLTHRELSLRATFDSVRQREDFRRVAGLGERLLYSAVPASPEEIDTALATGRTLRAELAAPASPQAQGAP